MKAKLKVDFKVPGCYVFIGDEVPLWRETRVHPKGTYVDVQGEWPRMSKGIYGLEDGITCHICSYESHAKTEYLTGSVEMLVIPLAFLEPVDSACKYCGAETTYVPIHTDGKFNGHRTVTLHRDGCSAKETGK